MNIRDIAKLANVSVATVSRAMNQPDKVSPKTLHRINQVMQDHHFTGNPFARNLMNTKTHSITLLVNSIDNRFMLDVIRGAEKTLLESGYILSIINMTKSLEKMSSFIEFLKEKRASLFMDGLILAGSYLNETTYYQSIKDIANCPLVVIDKGPIPQVTTVYVEEERVMEQVALSFKRKNIKRCAIISSELEYRFSIRRCDILQRKLREQGIEVLPEHIFSYPMEEAEHGYHAVERLLPHLPQGIYAANEPLAMGALRSLHDYGFSVPDDVSVISGENSKYCEMMIPSISSIAYANEELGIYAAKEILSAIEMPSREPQTIILPTQFIPRES